jgi:hypothetical protein
VGLLMGFLSKAHSYGFFLKKVLKCKLCEWRKVSLTLICDGLHSRLLVSSLLEILRFAGLPDLNDVAGQNAEGAGRVATEPGFSDFFLLWLQCVRGSWCFAKFEDTPSSEVFYLTEAPKPQPSTSGLVVDTNAQERAFKIGHQTTHWPVPVLLTSNT